MQDITAYLRHPVWTVSHGGHTSESEGTCLMELASVIAEEKFSAAPECVHPTLAALARLVNDHVQFQARQDLVRFLPAMMTYDDPSPVLDWAVIVGCMGWVNRVKPTRRRARQLRRAQRQLQGAALHENEHSDWWRRMRRRMIAEYAVLKSTCIANCEGEQALVDLLSSAVAAYSGMRQSRLPVAPVAETIDVPDVVPESLADVRELALV